MIKVRIYTDGGCWPNPGPGGWGAVLLRDGKQKSISGNARDTTNQRMELTAALEALRALQTPCLVTLYSDSRYVVDGITVWIYGWMKKGWYNSQHKTVKNRDLWEALLEESKKHTIEWKWIRGHNGNEFNEEADRLATEAREALVG